MRNATRVLSFLAVGWVVLLALAVLFAAWLPLPDPLAVDLGAALAPPGPGHLLGTDELGRDLFARLLTAARATLGITAGATALNVLIGTIMGGVAGFFGGWTETILSFVVDLFWSVPFLIFVVLIVSVTGVSPLSLILTIGLINWVTAARIIHAQTARLRELEFVRMAQAFGYSPSVVLFQEILPNLRSTLTAVVAFSAIEVLTLETGLAFLGLSLPEPAPTWGGLLAAGLGYLAAAWWMVIFTAAVITLTLASLQLLSRGIDAKRLLDSR